MKGGLGKDGTVVSLSREGELVFSNKQVYSFKY